jgi:hypothetical protein
MNRIAKDILKSAGLIESHILLLEMYGIRNIEDLKEFGSQVQEESGLKELEEYVKEEISKQIDFSSKENCQKYLRFECNDIKAFRFPPFDRKKFLKIRGLVADKEEMLKNQKSGGFQSMKRKISTISESSSIA